jgi:hypothetical protein
MHQNIIQIPEINVRKFIGEDALQFRVGGLTRILIDLAARLVDQRVYSWV